MVVSVPYCENEGIGVIFFPSKIGIMYEVTGKREKSVTNTEGISIPKMNVQI